MNVRKASAHRAKGDTTHAGTIPDPPGGGPKVLRTILAMFAVMLVAQVSPAWAGPSLGEVVQAGEFYFSTAGDDAHPGTPEEPKRTLAHASQLLQEGADVYLKRGDAWYQYDIVAAREGRDAGLVEPLLDGQLPDAIGPWEVYDVDGGSGTVVGAWGDPLEPMPVVAGMFRLGSPLALLPPVSSLQPVSSLHEPPAWTEEGPDTWSIELSEPATDSTPLVGVWRAFFDGEAMKRVDNVEALQDHAPGTAYFHDGAFHVRSQDTPLWHDVEVIPHLPESDDHFGARWNPALVLQDVTGLTFQGIEFRGGQRMTVSGLVPTREVSFLECQVRRSGNHGMLFQWTLDDGDNVHDRLTIADSYLDRDWHDREARIDETERGEWQEPNGDGIILSDAVQGFVIRDNEIVDYGHGHLSIRGFQADAVGVHDGLVEGNLFYNDASHYSRGFSVWGIEDKCTGHVVRRNVIFNMSTSSKVSGEGNLVYANLFAHHQVDPKPTWSSNGSALTITTRDPTYASQIGREQIVARNNVIVHNTLYDIEGFGLKAQSRQPISANGDPDENIGPNLVANNLFSHVGDGGHPRGAIWTYLSSRSPGPQALRRNWIYSAPPAGSVEEQEHHEVCRTEWGTYWEDPGDAIRVDWGFERVGEFRVCHHTDYFSVEESQTPLSEYPEAAAILAGFEANCGRVIEPQLQDASLVGRTADLLGWQDIDRYTLDPTGTCGCGEAWSLGALQETVEGTPMEGLLDQVTGGDLLGRPWSDAPTLGALQSQQPDDPTLECPADTTVECGTSTSPDATGWAVPDATCAIDEPAHADVISQGTCPGEWSIDRTFSMTDRTGAAVECPQQIQVEDTQPPELACPSSRTGTHSRQYVAFEPDVSDQCDQGTSRAFEVTAVRDLGVPTRPVEVQLVEGEDWYVQDGQVFLYDGVALDSGVEGHALPIERSQASGSRIVAGPTVVAGPPPAPNVRTYQVTVRATDTCGNQSTCDFEFDVPARVVSNAPAR